ncbi:MAG: hypothetical protein JWM58_2794 [Rhizobium sp.]|nr:hypothetical protein [Rhizobium sp.]
MTETFKDRDEHRGNPAPHLGQDHYEKSKVESRAAGRDSGPTFTPENKPEYREQPQQPADATYRAQRDIEAGSTRHRDKRPDEIEEAVEDLDNGLAIKPD